MRCFIFALAMVIGSAGQAAYAQQASQQIGLFRMALAKFESSEAPKMSRPATRLQACLGQGSGGCVEDGDCCAGYCYAAKCCSSTFDCRM